MPLLAASGVFACPTGSIGTTLDVTCIDASGTPFQPKAVYLFNMGGRTETEDAVGALSLKYCAGFGTSGTNRYCVSGAATLGALDSDGSKRFSNAAIFEMLNIAGATQEGILDLDAVGNWPADGFRVIVDNVFDNAYQIGWMAWGGGGADGITNSTIVLFQEPAATGTQDITSPGFTCTDGNGVVMFLSMGDATAPPAVFFDRAAKIMVGAASSPSKQAVLVTNDDQGATTMDMTSHCTDALAIAIIPDTGSTTVDGRATFDSWITNGFRLNWAARASTRYIAALVIKGGKWEVGSFLTVNNTSTPIVESFGFTPKLVGPIVGGSKPEDSAATAASHNQLSMGMFTSPSNRHCQSFMVENTTATEEPGSAIEFDEFYANLSLASAVEGLADVESIDPGGFTAIMDDADPLACFAWYVAAGNPIASLPLPRSRGRGIHPALLQN